MLWQILHAALWKFSKLLSSGISLNWSINDEVTTHARWRRGVAVECRTCDQEVAGLDTTA